MPCFLQGEAEEYGMKVQCIIALFITYLPSFMLQIFGTLNSCFPLAHAETTSPIRLDALNISFFFFFYGWFCLLLFGLVLVKKIGPQIEIKLKKNIAL